MSLYQQRLAQPGKPELVLLHGWGMNAEVWLPLLEPLSQHYSLTLFDLPGLGRSAAVAGECSASALATSLLAAAPEQAHWLGWSLGGNIAAAAAVQAPQRVLSLTTVASNPCFVQRPDWPAAMSEDTFTGFQQLLASQPAKTLSRFIMLQTQGGTAAREILRQLKALLNIAEPAALADTLALLAQDQRALLAQLRCPLLTLWGEQDSLVPQAAVQATLALQPQQQSRVYRGAGHLPFLSDQDAFIADLHAFTEAAV